MATSERRAPLLQPSGASALEGIVIREFPVSIADLVAAQFFSLSLNLVVACEEWQKLLKRYSALVTAYSEAVNESLTLSGEKFEKARAHFDQLRVLGQSARAALEEHERAHGCRPGNAKP